MPRKNPPGQSLLWHGILTGSAGPIIKSPRVIFAGWQRADVKRRTLLAFPNSQTSAFFFVSNCAAPMDRLGRIFRGNPQPMDSGSTMKGSVQQLNISNQNMNSSTVFGSGDVYNYNQNINYFTTSDMPKESVRYYCYSSNFQLVQ